MKRLPRNRTRVVSRGSSFRYRTRIRLPVSPGLASRHGCQDENLWGCIKLVRLTHSRTPIPRWFSGTQTPAGLRNLLRCVLGPLPQQHLSEEGPLPEVNFVSEIRVGMTSRSGYCVIRNHPCAPSLWKQLLHACESCRLSSRGPFFRLGTCLFRFANRSYGTCSWYFTRS